MHIGRCKRGESLHERKNYSAWAGRILSNPGVHTTIYQSIYLSTCTKPIFSMHDTLPRRIIGWLSWLLRRSCGDWKDRDRYTRQQVRLARHTSACPGKYILACCIDWYGCRLVSARIKRRKKYEEELRYYHSFVTADHKNKYCSSTQSSL